MIRHEAYILKDWEQAGIASLFVARLREDNSADYAVFLVDLFCLGVKETFLETRVPTGRLAELRAAHLPKENAEPFPPADAKKMIEGAVAYAEKLGFEPHRDFRKARKVFNGLDLSTASRDFTYGQDGRPGYIRGPHDTDERVARICAILKARCGIDGFDYEDSGSLLEEDDDPATLREDLMDCLDNAPRQGEIVGFYALSGLTAALLICPTIISPLKIMDVLWGPNVRVWKTQAEAMQFSSLLMRYWNFLNSKVQNALLGPAAMPERIVDVWIEDFSGADQAVAVFCATTEWAHGFLRATIHWPEAWKDALARPDLALYWQSIRWWAACMQHTETESLIAQVKSPAPHTVNEAVVALARALRPLGSPNN